MKVIILCGGKGVRAFPFTSYLPKPMMPLGGTPILVHVINSFIHQNFKHFIIAAGYLQSVLHDYFSGKDLGAEIKIVDTGEETDTGGRVYACRDLVGDEFMVTYSDGLCDVPLNELIQFHRSHQGLATITTVPMRSQYGILTFDSGWEVKELIEKPIIKDMWINAGFVVFDREVFNHWQGNNLEREIFPYLAGNKLLYGYKHNGFFKSLDSYKDLLEFEGLIGNGAEFPWKVKDQLCKLPPNRD